jgi:chromosome segregation ATPase
LKHARKMTIHVEGSLLQKALVLEVSPAHTVQDIKAKVSEKVIGAFYLRLRQHTLKIAQTMEDAGIEDGSTLTVVKKHATDPKAQAKARMRYGQKTSRAYADLNAIKESTNRMEPKVDAIHDFILGEMPGGCTKAEAIKRNQNQRDLLAMQNRVLRNKQDKRNVAEIVSSVAADPGHHAPAAKKRRVLATVSPELAAAKQEVKTIKDEIGEMKKTVADLKAAYHAEQDDTEQCQQALDKYVEAQQGLKDKQTELREANKKVNERKSTSSAPSSAAPSSDAPSSAAPRARATPQGVKDGEDID